MMQWNPVATELTTAATDGLLALAALGCAAVVARSRNSGGNIRLQLWIAIFLISAVGALFGALAHGLLLTPVTQFWIWQPIYLTVGVGVSLFVVAAANDLFGRKVVRPTLAAMLFAAFTFYWCTLVENGRFWVFVAYEAGCMILALGAYCYMAVGGERGAAPVALGIVLSLVAASIQAGEAAEVRVGPWPLDHNGVFHLVQIPALVLLAIGVRRFETDQERPLPALDASN